MSLHYGGNSFMNSKFKSLLALSLVGLFFTAQPSTYDIKEAEQEQQEQTSCFGTKSKVALTLLGAAGVYVGYKAYQNPEAFKQTAKNAYNACTLENVKALPGMAKEKAVAAYNACTKENAQAVITSAKEGAVALKNQVVDSSVALKNKVVSGAQDVRNACTLENVKTYSGYNWLKSFFSKKENQEIAALSAVTGIATVAAMNSDNA